MTFDKQVLRMQFVAEMDMHDDAIRTLASIASARSHDPVDREGAYEA